ncbi:MAG TPA: ABC transporter permease [Bacteroidota bacterium]|nr:ABC transporter permease [Bacteroidota bacterium]
MEHIRTTISEFLADLRAQKLRAFLTTFGIIWGTVAIVVLIAFGVGFKKQVSKDMHGLGESIAILFPGSTTKAYEGFGVGRPIRLVEEDAKLLETQVPALAHATPEYGKRKIAVRVGQNIANPLITGIFPVYAELRNIIAEPNGRFINDDDIVNRRRVVMLGNKIKDFLFGESDAVGKLVYVDETPFVVVGVMQPKTQNSSYNSRDRDRVFIPASTFSSVFGNPYINNIIYTPKDPRESKAVETQVREVLGKKYKFDAADQDAIWVWDTTEEDKFLFYFFLAFDIFMGLIGSFTLGVAGIGVANIMVIVVQERYREIGVKRAVGAKKSNVMFQFFLETMFIIGIGSVIGFVISLGVIQLLQYIPIKEYVGAPEMSWEVVVATVGILTLIGLAAGLMPARRAANLNIVECLR